MNVQIFTDPEVGFLISIDMTKVASISEADAGVILRGLDGYKKDADIMKYLSECSNDDLEKVTGFVIDALVHTDEDLIVQCKFTANELWHALDMPDAGKFTEKEKRGILFKQFTNEAAHSLMVRYWKDIADTPLTTKLLGESRFRVPQQRSDSIPTKEEKDDPNVCKKLLCSLVMHDGTLIWDEIVYPGYAEDIESDEFLAMMDALDFARCDDKDHNDLIVTDDIVCLAERMTEEWKGEYRGESACEYVAHVLDAMVGGQLKADEIIIDGRMFNAAEGQRIYVSRYTKDIVYDGRTQEYLKKIGKELKK